LVKSALQTAHDLIHMALLLRIVFLPTVLSKLQSGLPASPGSCSKNRTKLVHVVGRAGCIRDAVQLSLYC
jgi:hypothetical protein